MQEGSPGTGGLPKAVLLDLDDTLLAFSRNADQCWEAVCGTFASRCGGATPEALLSAIHQSRDWFWSDPERHRRGRLDLDAARREIVVRALERLGIDDRALAYAIGDTYSRLREEGLELYPDAVDTLCRLRAAGVRLALITNGAAESQRRKVEQYGLAPYFDCILIEGEFGCGKPDERVYRHALAQLGAEPHEVWMVGDNLEWEVAAPQRLGIFAVWFDVSGRGLPAGSTVRPDRIIRSIGELLQGTSDREIGKEALE
jgi:putative hydrolase of the HAD superfamily